VSALLEKEYKVFCEHLKEFLPQRLNQFVLIKEDKVIGFFNSYEDALRDGLKRFGNVPFFIKVIQKDEEVHFFHQGVS
jgi:hypothetical protein